MPKMLALIAEQRQRAASTLASPERRLQQGVTGGEPITAFTNPRTSAHTPSLRVSMGHIAVSEEGGGGHEGFGFGLGLGLGQVPHPETMENKMRLRQRKRATLCLEAIAVLKWFLLAQVVSDADLCKK